VPNTDEQSIEVRVPSILYRKLTRGSNRRLIEELNRTNEANEGLGMEPAAPRRFS